ncbi:unnamed protein product [Citrullus colocynthis]|uniref:Uncharacterized protein n=1 Tax=Citrullus colocynthis TaxID=252529 RepID=A0ABP0YJI0_9ROSI
MSRKPTASETFYLPHIPNFLLQAPCGLSLINFDTHMSPLNAIEICSCYLNLIEDNTLANNIMNENDQNEHRGGARSYQPLNDKHHYKFLETGKVLAQINDD